MLSTVGAHCEKCGRNLLQRWEKPGDLAYDAPLLILPRDDGSDSFWCWECYNAMVAPA